MKPDISNKTFGMFTDEGNRYVRLLVIKVLKMPLYSTDDDIHATLLTGMESIRKEGHAEVFDTDVQDQMLGYIKRETGKRLFFQS